MNFLPLSDLHLERMNYQFPLVETFAKNLPDDTVVLLAGDIGVGLGGLRWADRVFAARGLCTVYVAGNHEYYARATKEVVDTGLLDYATAAQAEGRPLHVLNNTALDLGDAVLYGGTLWTDFELFGRDRAAEAKNLAGVSMSDFQIMTTQDRVAVPDDTVGWHADFRAGLRATRSANPEKTLVVVSHHLPAAECVSRRFQDDILSAAFASRVHPVEVHKAALWVYGHTHDSKDFDLDGTRWVCNPYGYYPDQPNQNFWGEKVVAVPPVL